jgi:hypothetical protein
MIDHANVACGFHAGDPLIMYDDQFLVHPTYWIDLSITGKRLSELARSTTSKSEHTPAFQISRASVEESKH